MKINLSYLLGKKRINLLKYCKTNNLLSYESLIIYCDEKNLIPPSAEEFDLIFSDLQEKQELVIAQQKKEKQEFDNEIKEVKTRRRGRKSKVEKTGASNKTSDS